MTHRLGRRQQLAMVVWAGALVLLGAEVPDTMNADRDARVAFATVASDYAAASKRAALTRNENATL
jgi:hypothetical protein